MCFSGIVREAERLVVTALEIDPANGRCDWLLAGIRHDYYVVNGMSVPPPGPDELVESAAQKHVDQLEVEQAFRLLKMHDDPLWGQLCSMMQSRWLRTHNHRLEELWYGQRITSEKVFWEISQMGCLG